VRQIWSHWFDAFGELRADVEEYVDAGRWVVCVTRWQASGTASGASVDLRMAEAYEVRGGKIVRAVLGYASREDALKATGLSE
jgi:SnoaL-like domain